MKDNLLSVKKLIMVFLLFFLNVFISKNVLSQGYNVDDSIKIVNKAKNNISILSSYQYFGRGYQNKGHILAANWIANYFDSLELQPLNTKTISINKYFQNFNFNVNIIDSVSLSIGKKTLKPGYDFIPHESCPPTQTSFKKLVYYKGKDTVRNNSKIVGNAFILQSNKKENPNNNIREQKYIDYLIENKAKCIFVVKPKLTASFSSQHLPIPIIYIADSVQIKQCKYVNLYVNAKIENVQSQNVIGFKQGKTDTAIVLCAHYDHLGLQGGAFYPGANDNASGVSFLCSLADTLTNLETYYSFIFIAFGAEEAGLHGSINYVKKPLYPLHLTKCVLNFDLLGNGEKGITIVGGKENPLYFQWFENHNKTYKAIQQFTARENAPNSDHFPFTMKNIPALFFYTQGGSPYYHDPYDRAVAIELPVFYHFRKYIIDFVQNLHKMHF